MIPLLKNVLFRNVLKICCMACIALWSCKQDDSPLNKASGKNGSPSAEIDEESIKQQGMKDPQTSDAFNPDVLQSYLPAVVGNYRGRPPAAGTSFKKGYSWTEVSRSYEIPTGDLRIAITDFADIGDFIDVKKTQLSDPFPGQGESIRNLNPGKNILAYESWSEAKHSGRLEALVADRFYIEITGMNLPPEFVSLEQILKEINIERLKTFPAKK